jgi:3-hydroxyisobutyrate dehydrogenase-like beta-hydroxyacid dehydrogenase
MVYDLEPEARAELVKLGAKAAESPRAVAEYVDMVDIAVSGGDAVDAVLQGPEGVMAGAHPGLTLIIHTSLHPAHMQRIAEDAKAHGIDMLDAQMSGGWTGAQAGKTCLMVGGDSAVLERCRPVLETTAGSIHHCGGIGMGAVAKIAQNLITAQCLLAASEGFRLAEKGGVDLEVFQDIVRTSSAQGWVADEYLHFWAPRDRPWMYHAVLWEALDLGHSFDISLPGAATAMQAMSHSLRKPAADAQAKSSG